MAAMLCDIVQEYAVPPGVTAIRIEEPVDAELDEALGRSRYRRPVPAEVAGGSAGYRHGRRDRRLLGSFGPVTISRTRVLPPAHSCSEAASTLRCRIKFHQLCDTTGGIDR
jgi:hypothetical protein